ncbi:Hypothetical protein NAEGRDRAFT_71267 [Naegleria gruberi]|uniref:F-box domain-containing protein n=1 Tax=Naegleria gruberi TaxID=5762 RepID=D2VQL4_NAEGR|nr:uncharacterized protein NAEGRDRAFT_71267 [Naegleria gruberi]EFC40892.1 Hypothetical protein NAEGRDRAFT_71267 [Naegleria gruberi]|eukprot:XP_002673636.1 Hypothetical protein NAEGRDRAFT_71267 [Naegleria gruberi strain NEG-M]
MSQLKDLPTELVGTILSYSTLQDSFLWNTVSKQWNQLLREYVFSRVFTYCELHANNDFSYSSKEIKEITNQDDAGDDDDDEYGGYQSYQLENILMRRGHSAVSLDDESKILVFGGFCGDRHCNELFVVDIDKKTVERKVENRTSDKDVLDESIMMGRSFHPMVLISENKFLVTGGYCNYTLDNCPNLRDTWIIEFSENDFKFTKLNQSGDVPPPMESHSLVYYNGYCISYGGSSFFEDDDLGMKHKDVYALNVESGSWTKLRIKQQERGPPALTGHSCHLIEGTNKMILYGGYDQENSTHNSLWMLHIVLPDETKFFNEFSYWEEIIPQTNSYVPEPTLYHRSLLLQNRLLVVYGGALD